MLNSFDKKVLASLKYVDYLPDEFKAWLWQAISRSPNVSIAKAQIPNALGEGWRNFGATGQPTLQNGWSAYGSPYPSPRFYKNYLNEVRVEFAITGGTVIDGTILGTLPSGYVPSASIPFLAEMGGAVLVRIEIKSNGDIVLARHGAGTNAYLLFTATFRIA